MGCLTEMSSKKVTMETKSKSSQSRKNRRRSTRNANTTNGEPEDPKERCVKRPRDINAKEGTEGMDDSQDSDVYKEIIDLLPASDLNCSPAEVPAPPGTRVNLHGVILHETQGGRGLIVLNVRWRNKVYSGALIDAEKNKWATDRLADGDAPALEDNKQFQAPPPIKKLRIPTNSANSTPAEDSDSGKNNKKGTVSPTTTPSKTIPPAVKTPRGNGKKRGTQESPPVHSEETTPAKKSKGRLVYNGEHLYECGEPNCEKKYKNKNGLSYHLRTMHPTKAQSCDESEKENKSDSRDESDSGDDNFVIDEKADEESKDGDSEDKNNIVEEQNGSQSDGDGEDEKKEELTENEKQIDRLQLEAEKVQALLSNMKQKQDHVDEVKQEEMESVADEAPTTNQVAKIKTEEDDSNFDDVTEKSESNEVETTEPLVDVETDSLPASYQWKAEGQDSQTPSAPSTNEGPTTTTTSTTTIPTIKVDPSPNEENTETDDNGDHPKGTSRTIIHEDHINSLNELFAPTQTYHQYSPTLTNLNPQKINESLTEALSKQPPVSTMNTITSAQSSIENASSDPPVVKEMLVAKPSIEIKPTEPILPVTTQESRLPLELIKSNSEFSSRTPNIDYVACSDDERSISPENALTGCHKTFPQDERDVKTTKPNLLSIALNSGSMYMNPLLQTMLEQSILGQPHSILGQSQRTFEKGLLFKELGNKCSNAALSMNSFQSKLPTSLPSSVSSKMMLHDIPLISNVDPKSLSNSSNMNLSSTPSDTKSSSELPFDPSAPREYPLKPSLLEQRLMAQTQPAKSDLATNVSTTMANKVFLPQNSNFDSAPQQREYPLKPSLLEQRLLAETVKTEATSMTSSNKFLQQPGMPASSVPPRPCNKQEEADKNENSEKNPTTSSFTVNRDLVNTEKPKTSATSLRINPPTSLEERVQIGTHTWFPEVVADANNPSLSTPDYYSSPPVVSSSFRIPVPKTYPSYSIQSSVNTSSVGETKNSKNIATKRTMQPVPIAPAPSLQPSRPEFSAPPIDYVSPNGDKEQPQMSRFTLTSDNRLIPSPAENRGRPRKVRVEKTKQIPIGTAQDIAKVRGPAETSLPRKPSSSPVVRTSVIQGSLHPGLEGSPKPPDRNPDGHMLFPQHRDMRNYEASVEERERFNAHEKDMKPPIELRNSEKYQGIGSPPGMYFSPPVGRGLLSPPLPRSASHSPRPVDMLTRPVDVLTRPGAPIPRSSPVGHPDAFSLPRSSPAGHPAAHPEVFSKAQFQMALERMAENNPNYPGSTEHARTVLEHARRKPELLRPVSESPHDNRKHPLSPLSETLHVMQAYARAHEQERENRMAEYLGSGRYQPPPGLPGRGDFPIGRSEGPRSMFEHRISPADENEQARLIRDRERYMQQNTLSRPNVYRGSPPSHSQPQQGHHTASNLVLGTADGSIIGPLSSYENRPAEHKR